MKDARREELLGRLEALFLERGFSELTLDEIAAHLRCSKSALYALASSKEQLVTTVVKRFFRTATTTIEARVADIADPAEKIGEYLAAVGDEMRRMSPACYDDIAHLPLTHAVYDLNSQAAAASIRKIIQEGVRKGLFRPVHADFVGEAVSLLIEGIQHGDLLKRVGMSSAEAYSELSAFVLAALGNAETTSRSARTQPAPQRPGSKRPSAAK